jgi:polyisoprenoid-binding protein YceI
MKRYRLDLEQSEISWTGVQPAKEMSGKVFFKGGMVCMDQGTITEAELIIDMHSIQATDEKLDDISRNQLAADLKSVNFFNVDVYPAAMLKTKEIKSLSIDDIKSDTTYRTMNATHEVSALLTVKEITHEIRFGVKIAYVPNHLKIDAILKIDRTLWGVNYMREKSYGDKRIEDDILIGVKLTAEGIDETDA